MVELLRHRQTKGPVSARPHLNRRATPRLHLKIPVPVILSAMAMFSPVMQRITVTQLVTAS
jgi:hypothetical protein